MATSPETVRPRKDNNGASASKSPKTNSSSAKGRPPKSAAKKSKGNEAKAARESTLKMVGYSLLFAILAIAGSIVLLKGVSLHEDYFASRLAAKESTSNAPSEPVVDGGATESEREAQPEVAQDLDVPPIVEEEETVEVQAEEDSDAEVSENSKGAPQPEASVDDKAESPVPSTDEIVESGELHPGED